MTADPARQRGRKEEEVGVFRLSSLPDEKADIVQREGRARVLEMKWLFPMRSNSIQS